MEEGEGEKGEEVKRDPSDVQGANEPLMGETKPEILLHAITRTPHSSTIRLLGWIGGIFIAILVDLGSTHNFINTTRLPKLKLVTCKYAQLTLRVANGKSLKSMGLCQNLALKIQGNSFFTSLYSLNLGVRYSFRSTMARLFRAYSL